MPKKHVLDYKIIGHGKKVIVFVHYFGGDAGSWQWLTKHLKKKYTSVLINLPGANGTIPLKQPSVYEFAQYINDCIADTKVKKYTLCGHSMGAKLVLYASKISQGKKPTRLVLIAPSPPTIEKMEQEEKERMLHHPNAEEASNTLSNSTVKKLSKKKFSYAVNSQLRTHPYTWEWWLKEGMCNNIADRVNDLQIPTYVIFSSKDPVISKTAIFSEVLPNLNYPSVIGIGNVGHLIPIEAPRKLAKQLKKILKYKIQSHDRTEII